MNKNINPICFRLNTSFQNRPIWTAWRFRRYLRCRESSPVELTFFVSCRSRFHQRFGLTDVCSFAAQKWFSLTESLKRVLKLLSLCSISWNLSMGLRLVDSSFYFTLINTLRLPFEKWRDWRHLIILIANCYSICPRCPISMYLPNGQLCNYAKMKKYF